MSLMSLMRQIHLWQFVLQTNHLGTKGIATNGARTPLKGLLALLLGARTLLGAKGLATRNKKLLKSVGSQARDFQGRLQVHTLDGPELETAERTAKTCRSYQVVENVLSLRSLLLLVRHLLLLAWHLFLIASCYYKILSHSTKSSNCPFSRWAFST